MTCPIPKFWFDLFDETNNRDISVVGLEGSKKCTVRYPYFIRVNFSGSNSIRNFPTVKQSQTSVMRYFYNIVSSFIFQILINFSLLLKLVTELISRDFCVYK